MFKIFPASASTNCADQDAHESGQAINDGVFLNRRRQDALVARHGSSPWAPAAPLAATFRCRAISALRVGSVGDDRDPNRLVAVVTALDEGTHIAAARISG